MDKIKCHTNNNIIKNKMKIKQLLLGMSVLAFFSSCSNDELLKNNAEGTEKIVFNLPKFEYHDNSDKTRTALDVEAMGTTWSRDKEEKIGVFPADNALSMYTAELLLSDLPVPLQPDRLRHAARTKLHWNRY